MRQNDWREESDTQSRVDIALPPGTQAATLYVDGWEAGSAPGLMLDGKLLPIRWFGHTAVLDYKFEQPSSAPIRLTATAVPQFLSIRSSLAPSHASPCDPVLPATLLIRSRPDASLAGDRVRRINDYLASGQIDLAMAETAEAWLADSIDEGVAAASTMVSHLATHPLLRPDALGALLATFLCESRL